MRLKDLKRAIEYQEFLRLEENGYIYEHKDQSPLLMGLYQSTVEEIMFCLGQLNTELSQKVKYELQWKIEMHKLRNEWK